MGDGGVIVVLAKPSSVLPKWYFPRRFNIIIQSLFAVTLAYMMRSNLSIAILDMEQTFNWSPASKGLFLSSFFWGYVTTQLVGGMAARRVGPKPVSLFAIIVPSLLTIATPFVAQRSEVLFVACRVLTGVAAGATFPAIFQLLGAWVPYAEQATAISVVFAGVNIGTILIDTIGPTIIVNLGWPYVFYISGGVGFIWLIFWVLTVTNTPSEMKGIHPLEVQCIQAPKVVDEKTKLVDGKQYKAINEEGVKKEVEVSARTALKLLSREASFWVIVFNAFCLNWGQYVFLTWLPTYVSSQLNFDLQLTGFISITPNISNVIVSYISSNVADAMLANGFRAIVVRKFFFFIGCLFYIITLVLLALKDVMNISSAMAAVILAVGSGSAGFLVPGYSTNIFDLAPNHTSVIVGVSNTIGTIPGIAGVFVVGYLLGWGASWGTIWLISASFYFLAMVTNLMFADVKRIV